MSPSRTRTNRARSTRSRSKRTPAKAPAKAKTSPAKTAAVPGKKKAATPKRKAAAASAAPTSRLNAKQATLKSTPSERRRRPAAKARTPSAAIHLRPAAVASGIVTVDLDDLPAEGANGRFQLHFVYRGMPFVVRVLAKDVRGARLSMEGHLGFVPFSYEGPDMRRQLLLVLRLARQQNSVDISLMGEQRIALTANLHVEGALTPNSMIAAAATRIAAVKPLLDVIQTLQPYRRGKSQATKSQTAV